MLVLDWRDAGGQRTTGPADGHAGKAARAGRELLVDLAKARGLSIAPDVAVGDWGARVWKALDEAFPLHYPSPTMTGSTRT